MGLLNRALLGDGGTDTLNTAEKALKDRPEDMPDPGDRKTETERAILSQLTKYHQSNPVFRLIILDTPGKAVKINQPFFNGQASAMVEGFGVAALLPSGRNLILIPRSMDGALAAHRLSLSLHSGILVSLETDKPDKALEIVQPYLEDA
jgi:hypothetical protein